MARKKQEQDETPEKDETVTPDKTQPEQKPAGPDFSLTRTMQGDGLGRGPVVGVAKNYKPAKYKTPHGNVREDR